MYVRCAACQTCTRLELGHREPEIICQACGQGYRLDRVGELGSTAHERYRRALAYAEAHGIDLASAYSVLLGIMSLEESRTVPDRAMPPGAGSAARSSQSLEEVTYDQAFRQAVSEGYLTVRQALERGDRVVYASRLTQRHGLSMFAAFRVADNRISLRDALHAKESTRGRKTTESANAASYHRRIAVLVLGVAVFCVLSFWEGFVAVSRDEAIPGAPGQDGDVAEITLPTVQAATEVRINPEGQATQVTGPDPRSVLNAYCQSGTPNPPRVPLKVTPSPDAWTGFYRQRGAVYSIRIRKDPRTSQWVAGNGLDPILPAKTEQQDRGRAKKARI